MISPLTPPKMGQPKRRPMPVGKNSMAPAAKQYASRARRAMANMKASRV